MARNVTVYTQPACPPCQAVKDYLQQRGIPFTERDINTDAEAVQELRQMRAMTTPVTVIDGEPVTGFDEQRLSELLGETALAA